jgi:alpha-galactosidase
MGRLKIYFSLLVVLSLISFIACLDNGLGLTPPMGFNTWNHFNCNIDEEIIKNAAQALIKSGLAEKGYNYINLDDCWQIDRDSNTHKIIEDKKKFPSGIKSLADYIHSLGLKFGLYSSAGTKTCQGRPGGIRL